MRPTGVPRSITTTRACDEGLTSPPRSRCSDTTGITAPRRLATPSRLGGPRGTRVNAGGRITSATSDAGRAKRSSPTCTVRSDWATATEAASVMALGLRHLEFVGQRGDLFNGGCQILGSPGLLARRGGSLRGGATGLLGHGGDLLGAEPDLAQRCQNRLGARQDSGASLADGLHAGLHPAQPLCRQGVSGNSGFSNGSALLQVSPDDGDLIADLANHILDPVGILGCIPRQIADVAGDDREAAPRLAGSGGFDGAAHGQHGGLN